MVVVQLLPWVAKAIRLSVVASLKNAQANDR